MNFLKKQKHPFGFSMIEVLFAVVLLSVVLFGVIRLEVSQFRLTDTQRNEVKAYSLAHQNSEKIIALGKTALDNEEGCDEGECRCSFTEGILSCSQNTAEETGIFLQYVLVNNTDLIQAWNINSIVEWTDGVGEHTAENGGAAQVKRILY